MKILLNICGSISAYKSFDLTRGLVNQGHQVKVILTSGALKFVVPEVYSYLGADEVYLDDADFKHKNVLHVELARWCDTFAIAPLSANALSRLTHGEASDLMTSVFLALESHKTIAVFPAMNSHMLAHPFTQENLLELKKLKSLQNVFISETNAGVLACDEVGNGKLPTVEEIIALLTTLRAPFTQSNELKKVVITTGATIAPLDPVRYLTNSSSGITGYHLAVAALKHGYQVVMIAGKNACTDLDNILKHPNYQLKRVVTVKDMHKAVHAELKNADLYISAAAISDIEFIANESKLKKESITDSLKITKATDILKSVIEEKSARLKIIGFAAETDLSDEVLIKKFQSKPVDLLVGTKVNNGMIKNAKQVGFNNDFADYRFVENGVVSSNRSLSKTELADIIFERVKI